MITDEDKKAAEEYSDSRYRELESLQASEPLIQMFTDGLYEGYLAGCAHVRSQYAERDELMREMWAAIVVLKSYAPIEITEAADKLIERYSLTK